MLFVRGKNLEEYLEPIRYADGANATLDDALAYIEEKAEEHSVDLVCEKGFAEYGNIFSFNHMDVPCIVLHHPAHSSDYFKFCITRKEMGNAAIFQVFTTGNSRQINKEQFQQNTQIMDGSGALGASIGMLRGGAVGAGFAIGSAVTGIAKTGVKAIAKGVNALTMNKAALELEMEWYRCISTILYEVFLGD